MKKTKMIILVLACIILLTSCVDQKQGSKSAGKGDLKIAATSMATVYIMEKLNLDLVAVPDSKIDPMPERYKDVPKVGMAMTPDIEKLKSIQPDYVF